MAEEGNDMCWICLEEASENGSHQLMSPCKCPRKVHPQCLARWQLQQAGRHEEKFCRFCNNELADWKHHLTPEELKPEVSKVQPIMVVYFEGQIHRIPVKQGPDGLDEFTGKIRELFRLPEDVDISLTFGCKEPMSGTHLKLEGMGAFDAAVHCASVAAAERQQKMKKSYSTGNLGSTTTSADSATHHMARSASNNSIPAAGSQTTAANSSSLSHAAGAPAAPAAADRRHRFQGHQQQQQRSAHRSRSFTIGSSSNTSGSPMQQQQSSRSSGAAEPPAAFRNILGMLGGTASPPPANGGSTAAAVDATQAPAAREQQQRGAAAAAGGSSVSPAAGSAGQASENGSSGNNSSSNGARTPSLRMKKERLSLRNISELTDVPESDETVAIGSLSGKFKLHLKAFSRKVARSLSFNKGSGGSSSSLASQGAADASSDSLSAGSSSSRSPSPRMFSYGTAPFTPGGVALPSPRSMSSSSLPPVSPVIRA